MAERERMLVDALAGLDENATELVKQLVADGCEPGRIEELLQEGFNTVVRRYEDGEYFLGDLIVAGAIFTEGIGLIPSLANTSIIDAGKVLIGVVSEDIHDIGKDIVVQVLKSHGFEVVDLGVDVSPERYVEAIREFKPDVATLSGVMGNSPFEMKRVIDLMEKEGLRENVPVIIGGACASERVCKLIGADAYAPGPVDTMKLCMHYMEHRQNA